MVVSLQSWDGQEKHVALNVNTLPSGSWGVYVNGELIRVAEVTLEQKVVSLDTEVVGNPVDIVVMEV
jgi:hypothetical protein